MAEWTFRRGGRIHRSETAAWGGWGPLLMEVAGEVRLGGVAVPLSDSAEEPIHQKRNIKAMLDVDYLKVVTRLSRKARGST